MQQNDHQRITQLANSDVPERVVRVVVSETRAVDRELMQRVEQQVRDVLPDLHPEQQYTLKMLCGAKFWNSLSRGQKIEAGVAMVHLVSIHALPLTFADRTRSNSIRYRLI